MITVQYVDPIYIQQVWSTVKPWFAPVFEKGLLSLYYSIDNLKDYVVRGEQTLLIGIDDSQQIQAAVTVQWSNYPNARVAYITAFGGNIGKEIEVYDTFMDWLKSMGATRVECSVRPSVARLLKNKLGFTASKQINVELLL